MKTISSAFYSLSPKTWLSIQVQQFCRHVCVFFLSLETFHYFEKCFIHVPPRPLSRWLTSPLLLFSLTSPPHQAHVYSHGVLPTL